MALEEDVPEAHQIPLAELAHMTLSDYLNHRLGQQPDNGAEEGAEEEEGEEEETHAPAEILLIFDQFEEIVTIDPTNQEAKTAFFKQVGEALYQGRRQETTLHQGQRWALFSMREDYIASLEPYLRHLPTRLKHTFRLDLLGAAAAHQAIQQPAQTQGVSFSPDAVTQLVDDLRKVQIQESDGTVREVPGPYVEPVQLQVVCHRLWDSLPHDTTRIDTDALDSVGDVNTALASYYDSCVADVAHKTGVRERTIREWFDRHLITTQGIRGQVLQSEGASEGLPNHTIWALIDTYLVRAEKRRGATWFELAHDRLIEPVSTSNRAWFDENLAMFQLQAHMWNEQHRPDGMLLHGEALTEAEAWATTHPDEITPIETDFLERCREVRREEAQQEAQRRRNMRIAWVVASVLSVLLVIALASTWYAIEQRWQAIDAKEDAEEKLLIAESQRLSFAANSLPNQPETALLLAQEAIHLNHSPVTEQTLRDALNRITWRPETIPLHISSEAVEQHLVEVTTATFHPNKQRFLTGSISDNNVYEWDLQGHVLQVYSGHAASVYRAHYSPDGQYIVTPSFDTTARIWDTEGNTLAVLEGHESGVTYANFSPDGTLVATASEDKTVRLWTVDGTLQATLDDHPDEVLALAFSPDSQTILTGYSDTTDICAQLWTVDGTLLATMKGHTDLVIDAAFSPDGQYIVTTSLDNTARLWDLDGNLITILEGHDDLVLSATFDQAVQRVLTNSSDRTARLWSLTGETLAILQGHTDQVIGASLSDDEQEITTVSRDTIRVWHQVDGPVPLCKGHSDSVERALYTPDGQHIVTASQDKTARVWSLDGTQLATLEGHTAAVYDLAITSDGQKIVTASADTTARVWSIEGELLATLEGHTDELKAVAISPDNSRIATASDDTTARVWSIEGELLATLEGHTGWIRSVAFSPDGERIVTASNDATARVWSIEGELLATLDNHNDEVWYAAFSPDGKHIATVFTGTFNLWTAEGTLLSSHDAFEAEVRFVIFSPDGQYILATSEDSTARLWDRNAEPVALLKGHFGGIFRADFSPDGQSIVTASRDGTGRLWGLDGTSLAILKGHANLVQQATFSPDGQRILTASQDGTARQFLVNIDDVLAVAQCSVGRGLTAEEQISFRVEDPQFDFATRQCPPQIGRQP